MKNPRMKKVGVIVGRFQVPELHAGHHHLVNTVISLCDDVLVILGCTKRVSEHDPFPKEMRAALFQKTYQNIHLADIADHPSDKEWSNTLDKIISAHFPDAAITLYGSRDSFLLVYSGRFPKVYIPPITSPSGTTIRKRFFAKKR